MIDIDPAKVVIKGRLQPGRMFLIDTAAGRIVDDSEIKATLAAEHPYQQWLDDGLVEFADLPAREHVVFSHDSVLRRQQLFGYTHEELKVIVAPMARKASEPLGSMGTDTPIAVLSERPRLLFDYFSQLFAQVTNPPLDAIREEVVTSVASTVGPEANLLAPGPESCRQLAMPYPIIDNDELAKILHANTDGSYPGLQAKHVKGLYRVAGGGLALERALNAICAEVSAAIEDGARVIVLSDRNSDAVEAPIPSLLLTAAVHHHLVRTKQRTQAGLVVECGDAREVHHMALLIGYGAGAINPYLAFESIEDLIAQGLHGLGELDPRQGRAQLHQGVRQGRAQGDVEDGRVDGRQLHRRPDLRGDRARQRARRPLLHGHDQPARRDRPRRDRRRGRRPARHRPSAAARGAGPSQARARRRVPVAARGRAPPVQPDDGVQAAARHPGEALRHLPRVQPGGRRPEQAPGDAARAVRAARSGTAEPVPLDDVESEAAIMRRFSTGAMSYGSISAEAHETLAIAMNRIGGKSNTGEGGEDPERLHDPDRRSAVKQVASGRFGVTAEYLTNADDLQIKMAQGAKPGEGGQLPGHKVYPWIAKTRYSTPGVGLISPPPHHDIYSIEDLKQLIHDLKNSNPAARVHVKLVAEMGVGTVAAGVSKAKADVVLISGHDGGTGASPLTSLKHAGGPWELGLAETQQTLLLNGLRDRIVVQTDGQLKTGRDVVIAALLGAEEFGFATAPLVVSGCVMMRVCHLDTCPVGIATQNPELRKRFAGKPEFVETFFEFIAAEVRELMAELGFRSMAEMIGHVEMLDTRAAIDHWKAAGLDLSPILVAPRNPYGQSLHNTKGQDHGLDKALDVELIRQAHDAIVDRLPVAIDLPIRNVNRSVGTMLGHEITKRWKGAGLPDGTIDIHLTGSAGQSFGAFVPAGVTMRLVGDANDYLGKGLSGGRIIVRPHPAAPFVAEEQIVAGNVIAYGATGGEIFLRGVVGERFCVRNSGALAVVEGIGDHGCEYMTGGHVVVLGPTGRNFGAGMSGGIAYVWDPDGVLPSRVNAEMVALEDVGGDADELREIVARHHAFTDSAVAARLLARWDDAVSEFVKVMPNDYKRVARRDARRRGRRPRRGRVLQRVMEAAMVTARRGGSGAMSNRGPVPDRDGLGARGEVTGSCSGSARRRRAGGAGAPA